MRSKALRTRGEESENPAYRLAPSASRISILVAVARNGVIGAKGKLPWHLSADLQRFKQLSMGHHIVMGRKTYESIGRLLPGRTMVIITRQRDYYAPGAVVAHSLQDALTLSNSDDEIFVIGGAEIFEQTLPLADRIYATEIHADFAGDVFFPDWNRNEWRETERTQHQDAGFEFDFVIYDRLTPDRGAE